MTTETRFLPTGGLTRNVFVTWALFVTFNSPSIAVADDRAILIDRLRDAARDIIARPFDKQEQFDIQIYESRRVLADIGVAQLGLDDLPGAQITAKSIPNDGNCGDSCQYFLKSLAAAHVRAGNVQAAYDFLKDHRAKSRDDIFNEELLAIARAQAQAGDAKGARETCRKALGQGRLPSGAFYAADELIRVAKVQIAMGDVAGATATRERIEVLAKKLSAKGQRASAALARLASLYALLGDATDGPRVALRDAQNALDEVTFGADNGWRYIAVACAQIGDVAGALRAASNAGDDRDAALMDVALLQWFHGDLDGAEKTIRQAPSSDMQHLVLVEIAKAHAQGGNYDKALASTAHIENDSRRAPAVLEVAAVMAKHGNRVEARKIAQKLDYPKPLDLFMDGRGTPFKFDNLQTWGERFEASRGFTMAEKIHGTEMDGDLLAAAVRCRTALEGKNAIPPAAVTSNWDVRKAAEAQAEQGDVAGALAWSEKLSRARRISALIGAAEGYAENRTAARQKAGNGPHFGRRHMLMTRFHCCLPDD